MHEIWHCSLGAPTCSCQRCPIAVLKIASGSSVPVLSMREADLARASSINCSSRFTSTLCGLPTWLPRPRSGASPKSSSKDERVSSAGRKFVEPAVRNICRLPVLATLRLRRILGESSSCLCDVLAKASTKAGTDFGEFLRIDRCDDQSFTKSDNAIFESTGRQRIECRLYL